MQLHSKLPSLSEYYQDLSALLDAPSTHVYIDTSFLMWLSKLGNSSRGEFIEWANEIGQDRIHIPLWASHEYHQHYIDTSISKNTKEFIAKLNKAAKNFYSELMPAIVEANMPPRWTSEQIKTDTRQAVVELMRYGSVIEAWCDQTLDERMSAVITFINQHCLTSGRTFEYLNSVGPTTDNRFSGRVPPGFQDRVKKDTAEEGGNRAGDLMFWKEILDHAREANRFPRRGVKSIIVLTNDMKNDWVAGKPTPQDYTIEALKGVAREGAQVPIIHPMLEHEAQVYSKVNRVMLMNDFALGVRFHVTNRAPTFVEITVSAKMPKGDRKDTILGKAVKHSTAPATPVAPYVTGAPNATTVTGKADGALGIQGQLMVPTQLLTYATTDSEKSVAAAKQIVDEVLSIEGLNRPITDWLTEDFFASVDARKLIWIGRTLAGCAVQNVKNASARVVDLLSVLKELDVSHASQLYVGVLFGLYFDKENIRLEIPKPEVLQSAFKYQNYSFAAPCMVALSQAFAYDEYRPAYLPNATCASIEAEAITTSQNKTFSLKSVMIGGIDFFVTVGEGDALSLYKLLGIQKSESKKETVSTHDLIFNVARAIGFPTEQILIKGDINRQITIAATDGIDITRNGENFND